MPSRTISEVEIPSFSPTFFNFCLLEDEILTKITSFRVPDIKISLRSAFLAEWRVKIAVFSVFFGRFFAFWAWFDHIKPRQTTILAHKDLKSGQIAVSRERHIAHFAKIMRKSALFSVNHRISTGKMTVIRRQKPQKTNPSDSKRSIEPQNGQNRALRVEFSWLLSLILMKFAHRGRFRAVQGGRGDSSLPRVFAKAPIHLSNKHLCQTRFAHIFCVLRDLHGHSALVHLRKEDAETERDARPAAYSSRPWPLDTPDRFSPSSIILYMSM